MAKQREEGEGKRARGEWILAGTDFSRPARQALAAARALAGQREAPLMVMHVIDAHGLEEVARLIGRPEKELRELLGRERRMRLAPLLSEAKEDGLEVAMESMIAWGHPFEEILKKAADLQVGLIVLGTAGRSADLERALFGSTAEKVLRSSPCPVLCVPTES
jgi:nucleotide-binding universal stress UspA family protein